MADIRIAYVCRDRRFNVNLLLYVTNISRIILSQSIKSLNLQNVQYYDVMKKSSLLLVLLMLTVFTGCDFLRAVAGRPVSKDIERKRLEIIKAEEDALQARLDSIRLEKEKVVADSLAAMDSLASYGVTMTGPDRLGGLAGTELSSRYYIIVGAFRESANARKLFDAASEKGYAPVLISCRSGMIAVGLCPSDNVTELEASYRALRKEAFCPKEAWILVSQ